MLYNELVLAARVMQVQSASRSLQSQPINTYNRTTAKKMVTTLPRNDSVARCCTESPRLLVTQRTCAYPALGSLNISSPTRWIQLQHMHCVAGLRHMTVGLAAALKHGRFASHFGRFSRPVCCFCKIQYDAWYLQCQVSRYALYLSGNCRSAVSQTYKELFTNTGAMSQLVSDAQTGSDIYTCCLPHS